MNELFGLAESPVNGSATAQSYGAHHPEQIHDVPFSLKYGALYPAPLPSLTTNDCFVGIAKYLLKLYEISRFGKSGSGTGAGPLLHNASYTTTSPLLTGTTLPAASTPSPTLVPAYGVEVESSVVNLSQEVFATPALISNFAPGLVVPIPILPVDEIRARSAPFVVNQIVSAAGRNIPILVSVVQEYDGADTVSDACHQN